MKPLPPSHRRVALAFFALSTLLSYPQEWPGFGAFDLGLVFAGLGPAALAVGLSGLSSRQAAREAFVASLVGHTLLFHWFIVVTVTYGGMPFVLGLLAPLLPGYWVAQFSALFAALWVRLARGPAAILFGALAWVAVDWLRGWFLGGFPWATLGYALHRDEPLLVYTRWGGVYALSFLAAAFGLALGRLVLRVRARQTDAPVWRPFAALAVVVVAVHLAGLVLAPASPAPAAVERVRIAAIQGNIDQGEKWDADRRQRILATYLRLSEAAAADGARVVVWPETAIPGALEWDPALAEAIAGLARRHALVLVLGGMGIAFDGGGNGDGERPSAYYDSAFVVDRDGAILDRYDKTHLVPFGEFVPLRGLFGWLFHSLASGLSPDDVTAGAAPRALELPRDGEALRALRVGVPICYELIFPDLVRRFAADGAGVLLGITNDAWYGRTGAPHQFLAMTALRSAETGLAGVRAANTGISAIIDERGRVVERSRLFEEAVLVADVPFLVEPAPAIGVAAPGGRTFYARHGDFFAGGCILGALAGLFVGRRDAGRRDGAGGRSGERAASPESSHSRG